jgi:hypothetical protein
MGFTVVKAAPHPAGSPDPLFTTGSPKSDKPRGPGRRPGLLYIASEFSPKYRENFWIK